MSTSHNDGDDLLLKSKLYTPAAPEQPVRRTSLISRLNDGLQQKATLIAAPAGYGKTTLAIEWVSQTDRACAWLSLDDRDNDIVRFWQYVCAAIEQAVPGFIHGQAEDRLGLDSFSPGQVESLLVKLLNILHELPAPIILVLDDWHVIQDKRISESMSFFVEYLPPQLHLCFISRRMPDSFKARWLSRGWVNKLEADDLRFTLEEAAAYFRNNRQDGLSPQQLQSLLDKTEGWITGLKLAMIAMHGKTAQSLFQALEGAHAPAAQFLSEEVWESLQEPERKLLLKLAVLDRFNPDLCRWLTREETNASELQRLVEAKLFLIPLEEKGQWYRLHHWFQNFLQQQLTSTNSAAEPDIYRDAAQWFADHGLEEEAIDYYLAGRHYAEALRLLERMKSYMIRGQFSTLRKWLSQFPDSMLQSHRYLFFSFIFALLWDNKPDEAELYLQLAERELELTGPSWTNEERNRYAGDLYYVRNFKATQFDMDMVKGLEYIQQSLSFSPAGTDLIFASPYMPLAPSVYRSYNGKRGRHLPRELADSFFQSMISFMMQMDMEEATEVCYGELLYERNELEQAKVYLKNGLAKSVRTRHEPEKVYIPALLFLARIELAQGSRLEAERWLEAARSRVLAQSKQNGEMLIFLEAEQALWQLAEGNLEPSIRWRQAYQLSSDDPISVDQLFIYQTFARMLAGAGELAEAWQLSQKLLAIAVKDHRPMDALSIEIFQAVLCKNTGKTEEALLHLENCLVHSEPDDYIRVYTDQGRPVADLLREYIQMRQKGLLRDRSLPSLDYARRVLLAFIEPGESDSLNLEASPSTLAVLLTKRELSVYRCMEEGLSNQEITERLGMGMGTLKSHINRIYSKFQVPGRVEAIRRGRELQGF